MVGKGVEPFKLVICVKVTYSEEHEMSKILKDQRKSSNRHYFSDIFRLSPWFLIVVFLVPSAGCSNAADEQATADHLVAAAAVQAQAATRQVENEAATGEAIEAAMVVAEAATAEVEEEMAALAAAEAEATADAEALASAVAAALAEAQATADALSTANAQATAELEATAAAEAEATAQFEATRAAFETEKKQMVEDAQDLATFASLEEGSLAHDEGDEPEEKNSAVDLRNFVVQTEFAFEPGDTTLDNGEFGLEFRATGDMFTCLLILQDGSWQLIYDEPENRQIVQEGETAGLDDGWNEIDLYVDGKKGFFLLNGEFVEELDLEQSSEKGDIILVTGLMEGTEVPGASTDFRDFSIWSLDPIPPTPTPAPASAAGPCAPRAPLRSGRRARSGATRSSARGAGRRAGARESRPPTADPGRADRVAR